MLTSKARAELRAQANTMDVVLMVGKGGVTDSVVAETEHLFQSRELFKGKVLETAGLTADAVSLALCEATGAEGIQCVGTKFILYRYNAALHQPKKAAVKKKVNPVRAGVQARRRKAKEEREKRNAYFREAAIQKSREEARAAREMGTAPKKRK